MTDAVATLRAFNRIHTERVGALTDRYLGLDRPLAQSRLLFEIDRVSSPAGGLAGDQGGEAGADVAGLRSRLGFDSGYLSRLLRGLEGGGLIATRPGADRRTRQVALTDLGRDALAEQDRRADQATAALMTGLDDAGRDALVEALDRAGRLLRLGSIVLRRAEPNSAEAQAALQAFADELVERFPEGFDRRVDLLPAEAMRAPRGVLLVALEHDRVIGCGALHVRGEDAGRPRIELRHMWVHVDARRIGLSRRLLATLEAQAVELGAERLWLGTHRSLTEALSLYRSAGYREIAADPGEPHNDRAFVKELGLRNA